MSVYWRLVCLDHDPELRSEDEFTQHTDDARFRRTMKVAAQRPLPAEWWDSYTLSETGGVRFLAAHPHCRLEAESETGERRPVPSGERRQPAPHTPPETRSRAGDTEEDDRE